MANGCDLLISPSFDSLQSEVFERISDRAGDQPASILYIENNDHRTDEVADAWAAHYRPLRLRVTDFNTVVGECYEQIAYPSALLDALTRRRLIDRALRIVANRGLLDDAHLYQDHFTDLITELEGEGYHSPETVRTLVENSDLSAETADLVASVYRVFYDLRQDGVGDEVYTLSEAYQAVLESETPLTDLFPHVDVVVISGFYELSYHEKAFLRQLAEAFPVYISLPLADTDSETDGANQITADVMSTYQDVASSSSTIAPDSSNPLIDAAGNLYTPTPGVDDDTTPPEQLQWYSAPTPDREVRQVARRIRKQLADGTDPNDILVVIPGLISYQEQVADVFKAAGIESVGFANKLLYQTYAGRAMLDLAELCVNDPRTDTIARLATNPLVTLGESHGAVDRSAIADLARRLPTVDTNRLLEELDEESTEALEQLFQIAGTAESASADDVVEAVRNVFEAVDLSDNVETIEDGAESFDARMEVASYNRVENVLDAVEFVAERFGMDDPIEEVHDALEKVRVPPPSQATQDIVEIVGPRDAYMQSYSHLYFVGLTEMDFPVEQDRPLFFERIFDDIPDISPTDDRMEARYQFATLLSSAERVYITTPETSFDDDDLLESSILDELARVTGLEPSADDLGNAVPEDVQRALRHHRDQEARETAVSHATETGAFDRQQAERLLAGAECAENRAATAVSEHDGQLAAELVAELHGEREPYSPTQLRDYAKCGFAYYMNRILGIEAPDEFHLEPQKVDLGSLVHDIFEEFYRGLQDDHGDPVHLTDYERSDLEERLLEQTRASVEDADLAFDDVFYDQWVEQLLAGLATPEVNEFYGDDRPHRGVDRGLFTRFLDAEYDDTDHVPAWFEVPMDFSDADGDGDGGAITVTTPGGRDIPVDGFIDRVSFHEKDDGTVEGLVHDYKTSDPETIQTIDGIEFQLPLYTLASRAELAARHGDALGSVDGQFYVTEPPTDVTRKWSLQYYLERNDGTDEDYERFLSETVPSRVGEIAESIEEGAFQTTTLPASEAGCRYCEYRDVCDVRHHQRQEIIREMDQSEAPGYIPQRARDSSFLNTLGGDDA
jgi:ATP-dependent helicase/nuclease subunit B